MKRHILLCLCFLGMMANAQSTATVQAYISRYAKIALEQERKYGIPAPITLAQGIIESGAGTSTLARKSNNHFGIKAYVTIIVAIVAVALLASLAITGLTEVILRLMGVVRDGGASYLVLCNDSTLCAVLIIFVITILSVLFVMRRLLRQTPGNLIYDR